MGNKKIHFEVSFPATKVGFRRFGEALIKYRVELHSSQLFEVKGQPYSGTAVALVYLPNEDLLSFSNAIKAIAIRYRSPTVFYRGTLVTKYASPEDELADKLSSAAQCAIKASEKDRDRYIAT